MSILSGAPAAVMAALAAGAAGVRADFPARLALDQLDGRDGFVVEGNDPRDQLGRAVAGGGDTDGDGIADLLIGAAYADPDLRSEAGEAYLFRGTTAGFPARVAPRDLGAGDGSQFNGEEADEYGLADAAGSTVAGVGDLDGDGRDDVAIAAPWADAGSGTCEDWTYDGCDAGRAYVVFGRTGGLPGVFELSAVDGANGYLLEGIDRRDQAGQDLAAAGDVDGDGVDDLLVGSPRRGEVYLVFGRAGGFPPVVDLGSLDGTTGVTFGGDLATNADEGTGLAGLGDFNGDGRGDFAIGAPGGAQRVWVVYGRSVFPPRVELAALAPAEGFAILPAAGEQIGASLAGPGDIDGDGRPDLLLSAGGGTAGAYRIRGRDGGYPGGIDLATLAPATGGRLRAGASGLLQVGAAGDMNGDGLADLAFSRREAGAWVVFGSASLPFEAELADVDGRDGFALVRETADPSLAEVQLAAADVNGDGLSDLAVGRSWTDVAADADDDRGETYVVYGRGPQGLSLDITGVCPGQATVTITAVTPSAEFTLYAAAARGAARVPSGPCAATRLDLADPLTEVGTVRARADGTFTATVSLPQLFCRGWTQVTDRETCAVSNPERTP